MKVIVLLLDLCCFCQTSGDTHSMKYILTGVKGISEIPEYTSVGLVDDMPFVYFDSNINRMIPKTKWIEENEGKDYWDSESQREGGFVPTYKASIQILMERFNQSTGVHTWQRMYGCQWDDKSGATDGFDQWGYDGEDFVILDLKNLQVIATTPESVITKHKWENNRGWIETERNYFTTLCLDWLKKYVQYGSSTLERKVRPEVTLLQKDSRVVCHATGFYPEGVMITWKKDGEEMHEDVDVGETLTNEDGTFQKRAVLTVSPEEFKNRKYTCEVAHKSGETLIVDKIEIQRSNPDSSVPIGTIIGVVVPIALIAIVAVVLILRKIRNADNKAGFSRANAEDSSQASSEKA
ncbi:BOLA class I histocompatibility antigen, alpha chain BL3-6-like isoform X2 [Sardina pilchardus]|uniref:BOLA class I histocompatibility antigen, alpha chain BL3-6-like isoform X2 n=1 Tax=Sardina pilchardus TaxID=27697 RepID=UPI002E0DE8FF